MDKTSQNKEIHWSVRIIINKQIQKKIISTLFS